MKFLEFKNLLDKNQYVNSYLIFGEDEYLKNSALKTLLNLVNGNDLNINIFSTDNLDVNKFINICNSGTFFGDKKIVVLKEYEPYKNNVLLEHLKQYLKNGNESTILVLVTNVLKSMFFELKQVEEVNCDRLDRDTLQSWIEKFVKQNRGSISYEATELLMDYTNGYLIKIENELTKLLNYKMNETITEDDVVNLVKKDLEYSIFELTDALAEKKETKALQITADLLSDRKQSMTVLPLIFKYFRRLFYVSVTKYNEEEIANFLKVKPYAIKLNKKQAMLFGAKNLKNIVEICSKLDYQLKTSKITINNAINYLVFSILSLNKKWPKFRSFF